MKIDWFAEQMIPLPNLVIEPPVRLQPGVSLMLEASIDFLGQGALRILVFNKHGVNITDAYFNNDLPADMLFSFFTEEPVISVRSILTREAAREVKESDEIKDQLLMSLLKAKADDIRTKLSCDTTNPLETFYKLELELGAYRGVAEFDPRSDVFIPLE